MEILAMTKCELLFVRLFSLANASKYHYNPTISPYIGFAEIRCPYAGVYYSNLMLL
jgi:hypothetical protein